MEWSNELTMEFLDLYEGEPSIWNPQNADHKDRNKMYEAWKRIQGSLSADCSLSMLKRKKENLMATYRKLALKVIKTKELYKPEWFAYEKMASFLHNIYTPRKMIASDEGLKNELDGTIDPVEYLEINSACCDEENNDSTSYDEESIDTPAAESTAMDNCGPSLRKKRKFEENLRNSEKSMDEAFSLLRQVAYKPKAVKDEVSLFCELLCVKLRALDENTRDIAMHEIDDLMFNFKKVKAHELS